MSDNKENVESSDSSKLVTDNTYTYKYLRDNPDLPGVKWYCNKCFQDS